jgi:hypothetical protein
MSTFIDIFGAPAHVFKEFQTEPVEDAEFLFAAYTYEDYSGSAFVLFRKDGKLFEVNGSHCSCYGLEGQWEPEETSKEALLKRNFYAPWEDAARSVIEALP